MQFATARHETETATVRCRTTALQDVMLTSANAKMIVDFRHAPTLSGDSADRPGGQHLIAEMAHCRSDSAGTNVKEN
jgi:hypothetical protein